MTSAIVIVKASPDVMLLGGTMVTDVPGEFQKMMLTVPEPDAVVESEMT